MVNLLWMLFFSFSVDPADPCEGQLYVGRRAMTVQRHQWVQEWDERVLWLSHSFGRIFELFCPGAWI